MNMMPASPKPKSIVCCTSGMFVRPSSAPPKGVSSICPCTNTIIITAEHVQMSIVSMNTESVCTRPCLAGCDTLADAAAFGAEPMPASFENRPRLIPCTIIDPANPPTIDWKSNASAKMRPNTAGNAGAFMTAMTTAKSRYKIAMAGTMAEVRKLIRCVPPNSTNANTTASKMPIAMGICVAK